MDGSADYNALLDQLQGQVNLILEQTGRVFASLATNPDQKPIAQVAKLKSSMPVAASNFHAALDQFESELQLATLVMRRDLAISRERAGMLSKPTELQAQSKPQDATAADAPAEQVTSKMDIDVGTYTQPPLEEADVPMLDVQNALEDSKSAPEPTTNLSSIPPLADSKPSIAAHTLSLPDTKPATPLQLDTKQATTPLPRTESKDNAADGDTQQQEDDKAPDTAATLDSLFNDPNSATADENADPFAQNDDPNDDPFDFSASGFPTADEENDNISSLLPGLEDYANVNQSSTMNPSGDDLDFNSLFSVGGDDGGMNSQGAGEQRDTTFDDLLADFEGAGMDAGDIGDGTGDNGEPFDFDSLFK